MPIGATERVFHRECNTTHKDATITRVPPGWVMHCFKCGASGFHHARVAPKSVAEKDRAGRVHLRNYTVDMARFKPSDSIHLRALKNVGMIDFLRPELDVYVDVNHGRVFFPLHALYHNSEGELVNAPYGVAGKTFVGADRKWLVVEPNTSLPSEYALVYLSPPRSVRATALVLTEDPISALKIREAHEDFCALAMLGLQLPPALVEYVVNMPEEIDVILWTDGDAPGLERGSKLYSQLKFLRPSVKFTVIKDMDPKDLTFEQIRRHLDCVRKEASIRPGDLEAVPPAHEGRCSVEGAAVPAATS